jgi:GNAT superfamily N-acetyltransferase
VQLWVAVLDGRVAGTALLRIDEPPNTHRADINKLMVHRGARGTGLGRALLAAVERAAAETGVTLLLLDTETGTYADGFYRSAGWTEIGTVPDHAVDPAGRLTPTTFFYKGLPR